MLNASRILLALTVASGALPSQGQERAGSSWNMRPGIRHGGRLVTFIPKHERHRLAGASPHQPALGQPSFVSQATFVGEPMHHEPVFESDSIWPDGGPGCGTCGREVGSVGCCENCPTPLRVSTRLELLYWWTKGMGTPALATTSAAGTDQDEAGVLGFPSTSILFGGDDLNGQGRAGGRITVGFYLDGSESQGLDITYIGLGDESESFFDSNINRSIVARPFFNVDLNEEDSRLIAFPNLVAGTLNIDASTRFDSLTVTKSTSFRNLYGLRGDPFFGYRYARLEDALSFRESTISLAAPTLDTLFDLSESFATENTFHGAEFGMRFYRQCRPGICLELIPRIAVGNTNSRASVDGRTVITPAGSAPSTVQNGLLAQNSNIGEYEQDKLSTVFDLSINLRRQLQFGFSTHIGYSLLFWSDVMRASEQIDRSINPTQIPPNSLDGPARPIFPFATTDFWAQGLNLGLEFQW